MVFGSQTLPKGKTFDLRPNFVSFGGEQTVERKDRREEKGRRRRRGRGREEEEERKRKKEQKGMDT